VVSKRELIDSVWQDFFVEESNLTHQVYELRKAFKQYGCEDDLIQTVPRRGYRFTGSISEVFPDGDEIVIERHRTSKAFVTELPSERPAPLTLNPAPSFPGRNLVVLSGLLVLILLSAAFAAWHFSRRADYVELGDIRSIAVLPIKSLDGHVDESLEARLTDSLITKLASLGTLTVRPTSSVMRLRDAPDDPIAMGRTLEVDTVLTGRTQSENGRVRLNLQLLSVSTGEQIWAAQLDGESTGMLAFQDAIANRMLASLNLSADQAAALEKQPTANSEAFEEFTKGRYFWNKRTGDSLRLAIASFENAVRLDSKFADAYVGLADSYFLLFDYSYDTSKENVRLANEYLDKAIDLDTQNAEAFATRGLIQATHDWDWKAAEASFQKAVELAPRSANARHRYAMLLLKVGRLSEAERHLLEARRLDPTSPGINMNLGVAYYFSKRFEEAAAQLRRSIDLDPAFSSPHWYLARVLWMAGDRKASLDEYAKASKIVGFTASADVIEKSGSADPIQVVQDMIPVWKERIGPQGISPHDIAKLYASVGDKEQTLVWLERSYEQRHPWLTWIGVEPEFDLLRTEPRFTDMINTLQLGR
jgi:TolB-like protein/cytochrome c-type biogenesis protein CcmH/NrfG